MIKVAIAIIYDNNQKILISQRGPTSQHPYKWELPGGKINLNETPEQALHREIKEEVGIDIQKCRLFTQINYTYPERQVELLVYKITKYTVIAKCLENQVGLRWVHSDELTKHEFLEGNHQLIDLIQSTQYFENF